VQRLRLAQVAARCRKLCNSRIAQTQKEQQPTWRVSAAAFKTNVFKMLRRATRSMG
jgi:hypothetical protein